MGKGKKFDKKNAKTFSVVHRSHEDALYYDNDASQHVLVEVNNKPKKGASHTTQISKTKVLDTSQLAQRLSPSEFQSIRENEGLAAQYGILYDDSKYDYMQHLRQIGTSKDGVFIEADFDKVAKSKSQKDKRHIEDLIKDALPSENTRTVTHDELENVPRELCGFNPNLDPRLREVLEALEDEAYVDNDADGDDDIFADLLQSGQIDENDDEFYSEFYGEDIDEWDMDNYEGEFDQYDSDFKGEEVELENPYGEGEAPELQSMEKAAPVKIDIAWERDFQKFKKHQKKQTNDWDSDNEFDDEEQDVVTELPALGNISDKKKKSKNKLRKKMGAMTDTSSFSMSSSALFRTEGLTLLDDRFEQLSKKFENDDLSDEEEKTEFNMQEERPDLEDMLDDFLDNYELGSGGRKLVKKDARIDALRRAADSVSRGKAAERRKREQSSAAAGGLGGLGSSFGKMTI